MIDKLADLIPDAGEVRQATLGVIEREKEAAADKYCKELKEFLLTLARVIQSSRDAGSLRTDRIYIPRDLSVGVCDILTKRGYDLLDMAPGEEYTVRVITWASAALPPEHCPDVPRDL